MKKVLMIGTDQLLSTTRAQILSEFYVTGTAEPNQAVTLLQTEDFDLLLVCYSTPHEEATKLIRTIRVKFPNLYVVWLLLVDSPSTEKQIAHRLVVIDYKPSSWLQAIAELLTPGFRVPLQIH